MGWLLNRVQKGKVERLMFCTARTTTTNRIRIRLFQLFSSFNVFCCASRWTKSNGKWLLRSLSQRQRVFIDDSLYNIAALLYLEMFVVIILRTATGRTMKKNKNKIRNLICGWQQKDDPSSWLIYTREKVLGGMAGWNVMNNQVVLYLYIVVAVG